MSSLPFVATRSAAAAIAEAADWWTRNRAEASTTVLQELQKALAVICVQPGVGARARNVPLEGVRRVHLSRIHYYLYYRVSPAADRLEILAFWHTSRGSEPIIEVIQ